MLEGQYQCFVGDRSINAPAELEFKAINPAIRTSSPCSNSSVLNEGDLRLEQNQWGFSLSKPQLRAPGIAVLPLASCQRIAFSSCALTASGREKFILADCFAPGAFLSFIW
jgi:hypothetical protein